jgi:arylsulfatase B
MLSILDDSVGAIVEALSQQNMLKNSIIIFSTDNGGPAEGFNLNAASNWPLRGVKNTLWEGGVRGTGFIWSPLIKSRERVSEQMMHITDWLPTLYEAAGGNIQ